MNIILHCQVYWPDNSAVSHLMAAVAEDAVLAGHSVTVVTSAKGYNRDETYPPSEVRNGVKIVRVRGINLNRHLAIARLFNFLAFVCFSGLHILRLPRPDCLVVTSSPPLSLGLGVVVKWLKKVPCVYVIEDLYPDFLFASGLLRRSSLVGRFLTWLAGRLMARMSAMIVLGDYMKQHLISTYPNLAAKPIFPIHNWHDGTMLFPLPKKAAPGGPVVFQYAGNFGKAHDFQTIIDAASRLRDEAAVEFEFIGGGKNREFVANAVRENRLTRCRVEDYVSQQEQLNEYLNRADVCFVTLKHGYEGLIVPSKIYSNMAVGKPIIYIGPLRGEIPDLIRQHSLGWMVEPGDADGLVAAIQEAVRRPELRVQYGDNARKSFDAFYERKIATTQYLKVIASCALLPEKAAGAGSR